MRFRLKALGLHLLGSCLVLSVILGTLYLLWYRWPGTYLADVGHVSMLLAGVDVVLGPILTFIVAAPAKPRRLLMRDVAVIATVQLCALTYGSLLLWSGRPLYYAFSEDELQLVQAYDIDADDVVRAQRENAPLVPHWYSLPRWIWAPLPDDSQAKSDIISGAVSGGFDVTAMPHYYRPWEAGLATLRTKLQKPDDIKYFSGNERKTLKERMRRAGIATDQANSLAFSGRGRPLLAVFDPRTLRLVGLFKPS